MRAVIFDSVLGKRLINQRLGGVHSMSILPHKVAEPESASQRTRPTEDPLVSCSKTGRHDEIVIVKYVATCLICGVNELG